MKPTQSYTCSTTSALGRWHNVDPMAETYHTQSPYHFSGNNPVFFIEQNGMFYTPPVDGRAQENGNMTGGEYDWEKETLPQNPKGTTTVHLPTAVITPPKQKLTRFSQEQIDRFNNFDQTDMRNYGMERR
jgi:hypothetical protein